MSFGIDGKYYIEDLEKQNDILKAFIKTHHPEIAQINEITLDVVVKATDEKLEQENKQLKEQLAIREKALELKVKKQLENVHYVWIDDKCFFNEQDLINYWLEQAKESIEND